MSNLFRGMKVTLTKPHLHFTDLNEQYQIGSIAKIQGQYSATLLKDNKVIGAVPESKLKAL